MSIQKITVLRAYCSELYIGEKLFVYITKIVALLMRKSLQPTMGQATLRLEGGLHATQMMQKCQPHKHAVIELATPTGDHTNIVQ